MTKRAKSLCAQYVPDKPFNETKEYQLANTIAANAIIGRDKSAVIVRVNYKNTKQNWREILFHEYMHIFCAKLEIDGEHFIDIYGSGHTLGEFENGTSEKMYDGFLNAGYVVWSEFIAQYYALLKTSDKPYTFSDIMDYAFGLLGEVHIAYDEHTAKTSFAMACAYLLTCDNGNILSDLVEIEDTDSNEKQAEIALRNCLAYLHAHLQTEKPWKINENFISELGNKFLMFKTMNSLHNGRR